MIIVAMNEAGLDREDSVRFYAVLSSYLISFASAQAGSLVTAIATRRRLDRRHASLHHTKHPAIAAVRDELESLRDRDIYESGVQVILDAVEARAAATRHALALEPTLPSSTGRRSSHVRRAGAAGRPSRRSPRCGARRPAATGSPG